MRARLRLCLVLGALFSGLAVPLAAEVMPPKPAGYFNDYAAVVDRATALQLNEELAQFERESSNQILVAIYPSMQSESSVADFTQRIAQTWGVGGKEHNNGAVLFVFVQNHQMFLQTGYGLEGPLPDAIAYDITHNLIAPFFKKNDYAGGLRAGVAAIMEAVRHEYKGTGKTRRESESGRQPFPLGVIIFVLIVIFIVMTRLRRTAGRRGYGYSGRGGPFIGGFGSGGGFSGGSSSGGGFSGGGGSFGGGGAGSSW